MSKPRVLIPLGPGLEELEAVACIDVLRRAGCHVVTASVGGANPVIGRNRIRLLADIDIADALAEWGDDWACVLLPGGLGGVDAIEGDEALMALVRGRLARGELVAAICAAPRALVAAGLSRSVEVTGHPGTGGDLEGYPYSEARVVDSGSVVTSRGAGTAVEFGLVVAGKLCGDEAAAAVAKAIVA